MNLNDSIVENAARTMFGVLRYAVEHWPQLAPNEPAAERVSFGEVAVATIKQDLPVRFARPRP
jgi:type I restriction enzyme R subunit